MWRARAWVRFARIARIAEPEPRCRSARHARRTAAPTQPSRTIRLPVRSQSGTRWLKILPFSTRAIGGVPAGVPFRGVEDASMCVSWQLHHLNALKGSLGWRVRRVAH